jgi:hypothetical protein
MDNHYSFIGGGEGPWCVDNCITPSTSVSRLII